MTQTRMENRMESMERSLVLLEQRVNGTGIMGSESADNKSQLEEIKTMLISALKGKATEDVARGVTPVLTEGASSGSTVGGRITTRTTDIDHVHISPKRVELPNFNGTDPLNWVQRAEHYFQILQIPEELKVSLALVYMEGHAFHWISWLKERRPLMNWLDVKKELLARFGGVLASNPYELLAAVKQFTTVDEYVKDFVAKSTQVSGWPEEAFIGQFLNGLRTEIRIRIRSHETTDLYSTMKIAREVEYELEVQKKWQLSTGDVKHSEFGLGSRAGAGVDPKSIGPTLSEATVDKQTISKPAFPLGTHSTPTLKPTQSSTPTASACSRCYTQREFQDLCTRGLCFRCQQPYHPLHHECQNKTIQTIILGEDDDDDPNLEDFSASLPTEATHETE